MPETKEGEKIPGTYCPLCGEMGLRMMIFDGVAWAVCPMIDGKPLVKELKDAHTGYVLGGQQAKPPATPAPKKPTTRDKDKGVIDG